ncbi:DUF2199 domain-containing protein [Paenarthrobacter sp. NPDC090522]|uniref:DUF2199 domain-containing protein n=1 Tax=Paenarthrobacter sp. NPDC090522 TaxID=3364383 RepID=UPI00381118F8
MDNPTDFACTMCGRSAAEHEKNLRFLLPDPVLDSPEQHEAAGSWLSHGNPNESVMMQIPNIGPFIRALLPVQLAGGGSLTYGVWVAIHPEDLQRTFAIYWEPEYADLRLTGYLANSIEPWGMLGAPVELAVKDTEQTPYCVGSPDPVLADVLGKQWPHDLLDAASQSIT